MPSKTMPIDALREMVDYNPKTGILTWRKRKPAHFTGGPKCAKPEEVICRSWNARYAGKPAFAAKAETGHLAGFISPWGGFKAHRVAWALVHGAWPEADIDHINGDPSDNRIENLREASRSQNCKNRKSYQGSSSVYVGVTKEKSSGKWVARIKAHGKKRTLGRFVTERDAALAYDRAAIDLHGRFAAPNILPNPHLTAALDPL